MVGAEGEVGVVGILGVLVSGRLVGLLRRWLGNGLWSVRVRVEFFYTHTHTHAPFAPSAAMVKDLLVEVERHVKAKRKEEEGHARTREEVEQLKEVELCQGRGFGDVGVISNKDPNISNTR